MDLHTVPSVGISCSGVTYMVACDLCGCEHIEWITVCGNHICPECEKQIVHLQVSDPEYELWLERIKLLWENFQISEEYA